MTKKNEEYKERKKNDEAIKIDIKQMAFELRTLW